ncbi:hypothetical protein GCM10023171_00120 [Microbacterium panaciterrae]|uniref:Uncharacterized protein n=1 Tax=Microbacterium panaciterrae TaxID=985759 RepID=A0ABP8P0L2_9MICO
MVLIRFPARSTGPVAASNPVTDTTPSRNTAPSAGNRGGKQVARGQLGALVHSVAGGHIPPGGARIHPQGASQQFGHIPTPRRRRHPFDGQPTIPIRHLPGDGGEHRIHPALHLPQHLQQADQFRGCGVLELSAHLHRPAHPRKQLLQLLEGVCRGRGHTPI